MAKEKQTKYYESCQPSKDDWLIVAEHVVYELLGVYYVYRFGLLSVIKSEFCSLAPVYWSIEMGSRVGQRVI